METPEQIAQVIREALDNHSYNAMRRDTRLAVAVLHRLSEPATLATIAFHRVAKAFAAAQALLNPKKPAQHRLAGRSTGRKTRARRRRR